jgi:hypothetical protein
MELHASLLPTRAKSLQTGERSALQVASSSNAPSSSGAADDGKFVIVSISGKLVEKRSQRGNLERCFELSPVLKRAENPVFVSEDAAQLSAVTDTHDSLASRPAPVFAAALQPLGLAQAVKALGNYLTIADRHINVNVLIEPIHV